MLSIALSMLLSLDVSLSVGAVLAFVILTHYRTAKGQSARPPGPKPLPIIGSKSP